MSERLQIRTPHDYLTWAFRPGKSRLYRAFPSSPEAFLSVAVALPFGRAVCLPACLFPRPRALNVSCSFASTTMVAEKPGVSWDLMSLVQLTQGRRSGSSVRPANFAVEALMKANAVAAAPEEFMPRYPAEPARRATITSCFRRPSPTSGFSQEHPSPSLESQTNWLTSASL